MGEFYVRSPVLIPVLFLPQNEHISHAEKASDTSKNKLVFWDCVIEKYAGRENTWFAKNINPKKKLKMNPSEKPVNQNKAKSYYSRNLSNNNQIAVKQIFSKAFLKQTIVIFELIVGFCTEPINYHSFDLSLVLIWGSNMVDWLE